MESAPQPKHSYLSKLPEKLSKDRTPCVLLFPGTFCPLHLNHIRTMEITRAHLQAAPYNLEVIGGILVPTHDQALRKKSGGLSLLDSSTRMQLLQLDLADSDWLNFCDKLLCEKENDGVGLAIQMVTREVKKKYNKRVMMVSVQGMDNLETAVRVCQAPDKDVTVLVMNRKEHFMKYVNTQKQIEEDEQLSKRLVVVRDEEMKDTEISSTMIRQLVNSKQYESLKGILSPQSIQFHLDHDLKYKIAKCSISKEELKASESLNLGEFLTSAKLDGLVSTINYESLQQLKDWPILLGKGLQGTVELMAYSPLGCNVAVKKVKINQSRRRRLDTVAREVRALAKIQHENVVRLIGVGTHEQIVFEVMEAVMGTSGSKWVEQNKERLGKEGLSKGVVRALGHLAYGCQAMADAGILHRDLTLDNILVHVEESKEGMSCILKVCDFGVSATHEDKHSLPRGKTRNYSPEGIKDKNLYVSASDLYSFGLIIYEMAHTKPVWCQCNSSDANKQVLEGNLPPWTANNSNQPLIDLVYACLQYDPASRPTFKEAGDQLLKIAEQMG